MRTPAGITVKRLYAVEIADDGDWHPFPRFVIKDEKGKRYSFPDEENGMESINKFTQSRVCYEPTSLVARP